MQSLQARRQPVRVCGSAQSLARAPAAIRCARRHTHLGKPLRWVPWLVRKHESLAVIEPLPVGQHLRCRLFALGGLGGGVQQPAGLARDHCSADAGPRTTTLRLVNCSADTGRRKQPRLRCGSSGWKLNGLETARTLGGVEFAKSVDRVTSVTIFEEKGEKEGAVAIARHPRQGTCLR